MHLVWKHICVYQKNAHKMCNFEINHDKHHLCMNNSLSGICVENTDICLQYGKFLRFTECVVRNSPTLLLLVTVSSTSQSYTD